MRLNETRFVASRDPELYDTLYRLFKYWDQRPMNIIESSTGDTSIVDAVYKVIGDRGIKRRTRPKYNICVPCYTPYLEFRKHIRDIPWITVKHALSVGRDDAIGFIEQDELLQDTSILPNIRIDSLDPVPFYTAEVKGELFGDKQTPRWNFFKHNKKFKLKHLWILNGVGGIGWLEFQMVMALMGNEKYWILLRDLDHVKHMRSLTYADKTPQWRIVAMRKRQWALVQHNTGPGNTARWDYPRIYEYDESMEE